MRLLGLLLSTVAVACVPAAWAADGDTPATISIEVTNGNVHDALAMIAKQAGLNISVDAKVKGTVTAALKDVAPAEALRVIAGAVGARVREDGGIYVVEPKPLPAERPRVPGGVVAPQVTPPGGPTVAPQVAPGDIPAGDEEVIRLIKLKYADPTMIANAFGAGVVGSGMSMMGGSPFRQGGGRGGSGNYGGYGGNYGGYNDYGGYGNGGGRSGRGGRGGGYYDNSWGGSGRLGTWGGY